jgi:hypothetical protein
VEWYELSCYVSVEELRTDLLAVIAMIFQHYTALIHFTSTAQHESEEHYESSRRYTPLRD